MRPMLRSPVLLLCATAIVGCTELAERDPLPNWVGGQDSLNPGDTDNPNPSLGTFTISAPSVNDLGYEVFVHATGGDFDAPCTLTVPEDYRDQVELDCTLEIPELTLFAQGLDFDIAIAPNQCAFIDEYYYMYQRWPLGEGPDVVSVTVRGDGVILQETNALNGKPKCDYDHSWEYEDAPNCCYGSYEYSVLNSVGDYLVQPETRFWGGNLADCFDGAAYISGPIGDNGWPMGIIRYIEHEGFQHRYHWQELTGHGYLSNVPLASYWDPAYHNGQKPAGLQHPYARDHYLFRCLDHAEEVLGTIRLTVREWNTIEEFEKGISGNPHIQGTEPNGGPLDDRADWSVATPGSVDFIKFLQ